MESSPRRSGWLWPTTVLHTVEHPSADIVWNRVKARVPYISRATVYNTLNLFVEKGLLRALTLAEDSVVFDPNVERHHHLVDEESGAIPASRSANSPAFFPNSTISVGSPSHAPRHQPVPGLVL